MASNSRSVQKPGKPIKAFSMENSSAGEICITEYTIKGDKVIEQGAPDYVTKPAAAVWIKRKLFDMLARN